MAEGYCSCNIIVHFNGLNQYRDLGNVFIVALMLMLDVWELLILLQHLVSFITIDLFHLFNY